MGSPSQDGRGVRDHDLLLYVTAEQSACPESQGSLQIVAFALDCQTESIQDRPVAGVVNFCPEGVQNINTDLAFALTKHEILHALGISGRLAPFWRDANNIPRTPRQSNGLPAFNSSGSVFKCISYEDWLVHILTYYVCRFFQISEETIKTVTYDNWLTSSGRIPHTVTQLVTPAVRVSDPSQFAKDNNIYRHCRKPVMVLSTDGRGGGWFPLPSPFQAA